MSSICELKNELAEINAEKAERAGKLRLALLAIDDDSLIWFANAINGGEEIKSEPFESVCDFVVRVARECKESIPF